MKSGGGSSAKNRRLAIILGVSISVTSFLIIALLCWFKRRSRKGMQNLPFYLFLKSFYSFFSAQSFTCISTTYANTVIVEDHLLEYILIAMA